jgi:hypothetical protein
LTKTTTTGVPVATSTLASRSCMPTRPGQQNPTRLGQHRAQRQPARANRLLAPYPATGWSRGRGPRSRNFLQTIQHRAQGTMKTADSTECTVFRPLP